MNNFIEVNLKVDKKIIIETLERIGISNKKEKILFPTCYFLNIKDKDYILHFKQLFLLMRRNSYNNISEEDFERRNAIIYCLKTWGLIDVDEKLIQPRDKFVYVLSFKDKEDWIIQHKYDTQNFYLQLNDK